MPQIFFTVLISSLYFCTVTSPENISEVTCVIDTGCVKSLLLRTLRTGWWYAQSQLAHCVALHDYGDHSKIQYL